MNFWENVEFVRESKDLTRKELASLANFSVTSIPTGIIRGSIPAADVAYRIAKVLNVSIEYLLTGENNSLQSQISQLIEHSKKYQKHKTLVEEFETIPQHIQNSIENMIHEISRQ